MQHKKIIVGIIVISSLLMSASSAFAHVTVRPNEVGVAAFQTFIVGVPVEKDVPTTEVRLVIPDGLQHVTPNVKPGWAIDIKSEGEGESAKVTEITWTGGTIPAGQRDEFLFSAQAPSSESTVVWKAYQTYEDGSVVSWDQDPNAKHGHDDQSASAGPYSETKIINDLAEPEAVVKSENDENKLPLVVSIAAIAIATFSLISQRRKK